MAEDQIGLGSGKQDAKSDAGGGSVWASLLKEAGQKLVPIVVSTGSLLGFIAFAGAVIAWTRLSAVEIASDQAITAFPRSELVAIGSSLLLVFGFFGALAVLAAFLVDRGGRPTQGMARAMLGLLVIEGVAAILIVSGPSPQEKLIAVLLFVFPASFALWAVSFERFSELSDELHSRGNETEEPARRRSILRLEEFKAGDAPPDETGEPGVLGRLWRCLTTQVGSGGDPSSAAAPARPIQRKSRWDDVIGFAERHRAGLVEVGPWLVSLGSVAVLALLTWLEAGNDPMLVAAGGLAAVFGLILLFDWAVDAKQVSETRKQEQLSEARKAKELAKDEGRVLRGFRGHSKEKKREKELQKRQDIEDQRLSRRRPFRLSFNGLGMVVVVLSLAVAAALPAWRLGEVWLGVSLAAAAVIVMWLWRIAIFTRDKVVWFGLAVFLSIPVFGTVMAMARNLDDPQIQPVALIRHSDRPDEAIHGLYVTEADKRVYFATVGMEGCTGELRPDSGRLLWVPKEEVAAMSVGPLQSVDSAARSSLEMAFALTPAVETPGGDSVSLREGDDSDETPAGEGGPSPGKQRLEAAGPAVRPTFGRGLSLEPEDALPGDRVTLRMSNPIGVGFDRARNGRTIRVGGVPAKLARNATSDAGRSEYVKAGGRFVKLDKQGVYVADDGEMVPATDRPDGFAGPRYVRVADGEDVVQPEPATGEGVYLKLEPMAGAERTNHMPEVVAGGETIEFRGSGSATPVESELRRQAWNKDEIQFIVPDGGSTGVVTVDCEQLTGQPLLQVDEQPRAGFTVRMTGPEGISLDATRSTDDGALVARRWALNGSPRGRTAKKDSGPSGRRTVQLSLERNPGMNGVRLAVEDDDGKVDTAALYVVRIRKPSIAFGGKTPKSLSRLTAAVSRTAQIEAPAAIEAHGYALARRPGPATVSSLNGAKRVLRKLLTERAAKEAGLGAPVAVKVKAFGAGCPGVVRHRRHVDVLVMTEGVRVVGREGCQARRVESPMTWSAERGLRVIRGAGEGAPRNLSFRPTQP